MNNLDIPRLPLVAGFAAGVVGGIVGVVLGAFVWPMDIGLSVSLVSGAVIGPVVGGVLGLVSGFVGEQLVKNQTVTFSLVITVAMAFSDGLILSWLLLNYQ